MVYIPANRCILDLHTEKDTWVFKDEQDVNYNGPYWRLYTGQAFTGTGPNDTSTGKPREIIVPFGRDFFNWLLQKTIRIKILSSILIGYGILLILITFTY